MRRGDAYLAPDCPACKGRAVPAEGSERPQAFFVGEAPGPTEEKMGRPFVGRAGRVLRSALPEAGWAEDDIWITNIVKCFPYADVDGKRKIRKPNPAEVQACLPHLLREAEDLRPRLLIALGRTAAEGLLGRRVPKLGSIRGQVLPARSELGARPVFVTIHPSALSYGVLRGQRAGFVDDLRKARESLSTDARP